MAEDAGLDLVIPHATARQAEVLKAVKQHGSHTAAARALKLNRRTVDRLVLAARTRAAAVDPKLHARGAPPGYHQRGVSTLVDGAGNVLQQWIKTAKSHTDPAAFLQMFREAVEDAPLDPRPRIAAPKSHEADLLTVYPMGDPHLGMLSWRHETGDDFDLVIAERNLVAAVDHLVGIAPKSETALIINLGDFFHSDNHEARTARSGHALDTDGRWSKILSVGVRTMTRCIDRALQKHARVRVINEIGNHDDHSAVMLSICLQSWYRENTRVEVDTSPSPFHWHEFGKNLIGVHHGHGVKADALPGVMAHDKPEAWGRTRFRFWYCGHVHHTSLKEYPGVTVETFRTLATRDAWHHGQGYRAGRSMVCDVLHRDRGRILRHEVGVEALA